MAQWARMEEFPSTMGLCHSPVGTWSRRLDMNALPSPFSQYCCNKPYMTLRRNDRILYAVSDRSEKLYCRPNAVTDPSTNVAVAVVSATTATPRPPTDAQIVHYDVQRLRSYSATHSPPRYYSGKAGTILGAHPRTVVEHM